MVVFSDWLDLQLIVIVTSVGKLIFDQSPSKDGDLGTTHYPVFDFHFEEKWDPGNELTLCSFIFPTIKAPPAFLEAFNKSLVNFFFN